MNTDLYDKLKKSAKNHIVLDLLCMMPVDFIDRLENSVEQGIYTKYEYEKFMTLIGFKKGNQE